MWYSENRAQHSTANRVHIFGGLVYIITHERPKQNKIFWVITCQNLQFLASMFFCRFVTCQNLQFLASMFVCRFVTCQNLHFGKYVRLSVCYLPKFTFWQVCSFVGLSVCLSVSLSVLSSITHERFDISSPNLVHIWNGWAVPVCDIDK